MQIPADISSNGFVVHSKLPEKLFQQRTFAKEIGILSPYLMGQDAFVFAWMFAAYIQEILTSECFGIFLLRRKIKTLNLYLQKLIIPSLDREHNLLTKAQLTKVYYLAFLTKLFTRHFLPNLF